MIRVAELSTCILNSFVLGWQILCALLAVCMSSKLLICNSVFIVLVRSFTPVELPRTTGHQASPLCHKQLHSAPRRRIVPTVLS